MPSASLDTAHVPEVVGRHLTRSLRPDPRPEAVRVRQEGEMWRKPGSRGMRFAATEEFSIRRRRVSDGDAAELARQATATLGAAAAA